MTNEELQQLAKLTADHVTNEEIPAFLDYAFDVIYDRSTEAERAALVEYLDAIGIDFRPICKRKHPA